MCSSRAYFNADRLRSLRNTSYKAWKSVFEQAFPSSQTARYRFTAAVSRVSGNPASCSESQVLDETGRVSFGIMRVQEVLGGARAHPKEEVKQCRWIMETRDPRGGVEPSKCRVGARSNLSHRPRSPSRDRHFSFPPSCPRVFLGELSSRLTYTSRWRSNGHSQWNTEFREWVSLTRKTAPFPRPFHPRRFRW